MLLTKFNTSRQFRELTQYARYADILGELLLDMGCTELIKLDYLADYQGFVEVAGYIRERDEVFIYRYNYGSCAGCDEWEARRAVWGCLKDTSEDRSDNIFRGFVKAQMRFDGQIISYDTYLKLDGMKSI